MQIPLNYTWSYSSRLAQIAALVGLVCGIVAVGIFFESSLGRTGDHVGGDGLPADVATVIGSIDIVLGEIAR